MRYYQITMTIGCHDTDALYERARQAVEEKWQTIRIEPTEAELDEDAATREGDLANLRTESGDADPYDCLCEILGVELEKWGCTFEVFAGGTSGAEIENPEKTYRETGRSVHRILSTGAIITE